MAQILTICMRQVRFWEKPSSVWFGYLKTETELKFSFRTSLLCCQFSPAHAETKRDNGKKYKKTAEKYRIYSIEGSLVDVRWVTEDLLLEWLHLHRFNYETVFLLKQQQLLP